MDHSLKFRPTTMLEGLKTHAIVRITGDGKLGTVQGVSQKYHGIYLVRVPGEEASRRISAESVEVLEQ